MKHYIYRDNANGGRIALACDATDVDDANRQFALYFGRPPSQNIGMTPHEMVGQRGIACVLPHSVGEKHLVKLAPDRKPKAKNVAPTAPAIVLAPQRVTGISLFPHVTPQQFYNTCFYCGEDMEGKANEHRTKDHVTPKSLGGKVKVPCCRPCNVLKGQLRMEEYRAVVAYRNGLIPLEILQQVKFKGEELAEFDVDP